MKKHLKMFGLVMALTVSAFTSQVTTMAQEQTYAYTRKTCPGHKYITVDEWYQEGGYDEVAHWGGSGGSQERCELCGDERGQSYETPATPHKFTESARTPSTCSTAGSMTLRCVCGYEKTEPLPLDPENHEHTSDIVVTPATYQEEGLAAEICQACGATVSTHALVKLVCTEHDWEVLTSAVQNIGEITDQYHVTNVGGVNYVCKNCGATKSEKMEGTKENHIFQQKDEKAASCVAKGAITYVCTKCAYEKTEEVEINPDAHQHPTVRKKDATEKAEGLIETYCADCGKVISSTTLPKQPKPTQSAAPTTTAPAKTTPSAASQRAIKAAKDGKVSGVKAKLQKKRIVKVSWKKSSKYDYFTVYRRVGKGKWKVVKANVKGSSVKISGQKKGKKYSFKVVGQKVVSGKSYTGKAGVSKQVKIR